MKAVFLSFLQASQEYTEAYELLGTELEEYYSNWEKLGQNYFQ